MATVQEVLDIARRTLHDDDKVRWPDDDLLSYHNSAIQRAVAIRPDLFLGRFGSLPTTFAVTDTFPLSARFERPVADYIIARAESKDDEMVTSGRAALFAQSFDKGLLSL